MGASLHALGFPFEGLHTTYNLRSLTQWLDPLIIPDQGTAIPFLLSLVYLGKWQLSSMKGLELAEKAAKSTKKQLF